MRQIVISHEDANDITQEVFIKVWQKMEHFRGDSSLFSWIYRIATNESLNHIRKNKKRKIFSTSGDEEYLLSKLETDPWISGDEIQLKLQKEVAKLPERQRLIFNMRYFEDLKFKDIAAILKQTEGGIKSSWHIAEKKIKESFKTD